MVPQYITLAPIPAQNSIATQLGSENSGLASGPPMCTLPNFPRAKYSRMPNAAIVNQRYAQPSVLVVQPRAALRTALPPTGNRMSGREKHTMTISATQKVTLSIPGPCMLAPHWNFGGAASAHKRALSVAPSPAASQSASLTLRSSRCSDHQTES